MSDAGERISIITISRNAAATIQNTIRSVLEQEYADVEYIIVDGASTDGTMEIVNSYGSRISSVSEPDRGISDAFNKGIIRANGSIIGMINADDELLPGALETVTAYFRCNPDVTVIHGDILLYDGERFSKRVAPPLHWWYPWRMIVFNHPATFARCGAYERSGLYSDDYRFAMDIDMYLRWKGQKECIRYLPVPLAKMRSGGVGGQNAFAAFAEGRRVMVSHGYSPVLATLQYWGRCLGQTLLELKREG